MRVWDACSGKELEVIDGRGSIEAIAAGAERFPFRALARSMERTVELASTGEPQAFFPMAVEGLTIHPDGRTWAGVLDNYIYVFTLEGKASEGQGKKIFFSMVFREFAGRGKYQIRPPFGIKLIEKTRT